MFNDIITVLTQMRREPKYRGLPSPAKSLNEACFLYDLKSKDLTPEEEEDYIARIDGDLTKVLVALMATVWEDNGFLIADGRYKIIGESNPYLPKFDAVFESYMDREVKEVMSYSIEMRLSDLEEELKIKEALLASSNEKIEELQRLVDMLKVRNESKFDKALSRKGILEYIENQRIYSNVNQIFEMLIYMSRAATEEEYGEIVALRQRMIDACVPAVHNHNDIQNSNVFPGLVNNPSFPIGSDPNEIVKKALEQYLTSNNDGKEE